MKTKKPFVKIERMGGYWKSLHSFKAFTGSKIESKELLENCLEGLDQIFGRGAVRDGIKKFLQ